MYFIEHYTEFLKYKTQYKLLMNTILINIMSLTWDFEGNWLGIFFPKILRKKNIFYFLGGNFYFFELGILHQFKVFSNWEWGRNSAPNKPKISLCICFLPLPTNSSTSYLVLEVFQLRYKRLREQKSNRVDFCSGSSKRWKKLQKYTASQGYRTIHCDNVAKLWLKL